MVQKLTQMIGKNVKLYDMVLQFLRTLFLRTRNVHYCTLRAELLMSLHDLEISEICTVDPCHKVLVMWADGNITGEFSVLSIPVIPAALQDFSP